ncbi:LysR substrate-binding domain-containing protein [Pseudooceanicola nanhaiensis]|uniref:LysR substrate-binding domain-containing protein n=1 Tax=Pseudooceanicola nanhaiensis TaxID=375761 RepID=UPI001CD27839|nr:LysR substrate-binding domain-containing protein [Pseudooceanicola nanhaiensis]MCA0922810.1 LysR family transcriptional regulator [Pseudooceanicola nanhaiensis]
MVLDWTKLPSLTALKAFEAVAQSKSFSEAARSLNVTHAAIAQQVRALEEHIGLKLVDRSPRGVSLTLEGHELARALTVGFAAIAEGVEFLQEKGANRPVRVTTTALFAEAVIFPEIASFWSEHPQIEVSFMPSDAAVDLVAEGLDLAVRAGRGNWPGLRSRLLLDTAIRAYASPSLVDDPTTDWNIVPWLFPEDALWERAVLEHCGIDTSHIRTLDLGNPSLKVRAGEEGVGLVLEAECDVRAQVQRGTLKVAPIPIDYTNQFFIVTPPWKPRPATAAFIKWLEGLA